MSTKLIYTAHAIDPELVLSNNMPHILGNDAPLHISALVQRVFHRSILRMQENLTKSIVSSLNNYTKSGRLEFDEQEAVNLKVETEICKTIMQNTLSYEDYKLLEPDTIRSVLSDLLHITRKQVMVHFANVFNNLQSELARAQTKNAQATASCIMTFIDTVNFDKEIN